MGYKGLRSQNQELKETLKDAGYLVSGVGRPETIEKVLDGKVKVVKHRKFGDHHRYTDLEVENILDESSALGARWILTTGKDAMKLSAFNRLRDRLWVIELGLELKGEAKALYEAIDGWLGRAISFVLFRSPSFVRTALAYLLAFLWFDLFRIRRKVVLEKRAHRFS